jgi:hypothetical protein
MLQPGGYPSGYENSYELDFDDVFARASPLICLADSLDILLVGLIGLLEGKGKGQRECAWLIWRARRRPGEKIEELDDDDDGQKVERLQDGSMKSLYRADSIPPYGSVRRKEAQKSKASSKWFQLVRLLVFMLGTLPSVIKLFAMKGIPWTQLAASAYLTNFILLEVVSALAAKIPTIEKQNITQAQANIQSSIAKEVLEWIRYQVFAWAGFITRVFTWLPPFTAMLLGMLRHSPEDEKPKLQDEIWVVLLVILFLLAILPALRLGEYVSLKLLSHPLFLKYILGSTQGVEVEHGKCTVFSMLRSFQLFVSMGVLYWFFYDPRDRGQGWEVLSFEWMGYDTWVMLGAMCVPWVVVSVISLVTWWGEVRGTNETVG